MARSLSKKEGHKLNSWKIVPYCVVIPCMLIYLIFFYFNVGQGAAYSFTSWNGISAEKTFVGLQNYTDAFNSNYLQMTMKFTVIFAVIVLVLTNVLGLFLAVLLDKKIRGVNFFRGMYFFPAVMSTLTIAYIFNQIDYRLITLLGEWLGNGTLSAGLFSSPVWAPYLVALTQVWQSFPVTMVIFLAGLQGVPEDILESARIDGASELTTFTRIALPIIKPGIGALAIFTFINSWNDYFMQLIMLSSTSNLTISLGIAKLQAENSTDFGLIMAGAALAAVPIIIIFLIFQKYFTKGIAMGAVKG